MSYKIAIVDGNNDSSALEEINDALNDGYSVAFVAPFLTLGRERAMIYLHKASGQKRVYATGDNGIIASLLRNAETED